MEIEATLEQAADLLGAVAREVSGSAGSLDDGRLIDLLQLVEEAGRRIDSLRIATAAEVADRSRFELGADGLSSRLGQRRPQHLIEQYTRISAAEASRRIRLGALLRVRRALDGAALPPLYPAVAEALVEGRIGADSADRITCILQQVAPRSAVDELLAAERQLVDAAHDRSADLVAQHARLLRDRLDQDGAEPRYEELRDRAGIRLGRERNGMTPILGSADPIGAARLRAFFDATAGPRATVRFHEDGADGAADAAHADSTAPDPALPADTRSRELRNYDALLAAIQAGVDAQHGAPRSSATILATVTEADLRDGTGIGFLDGVDEPVPASALQTLTCDADVRRVALDGRGEVLWLGRRPRLFNHGQRLALAARDGGCIWPNCTIPAAWCDAHHVIHHSRGGCTDIENGVLLCSAHHHALHASDMRIEMVGGLPHIRPPTRLAGDGRAWPTGRSRVVQRMRM